MLFRTVPPVGYRISIKNALKAFFHGRDIKKEQFTNSTSMGFDSGSAALLFLLKYLREQNPSKTQIIVPVYTCYSIAAVVEYAKLGIVLCDMDPETLDFNYTELEHCINENTLGIISTHFFGRNIDNRKLEKIKNTHDVVIIEDAAQGGLSNDSLGKSSDFIVTSTGRGKPISTLGGGYLITRSDNPDAEYLIKVYEQLDDRTAYEELNVLLKIFVVNILLNPFLYTIPLSIPYYRIGETLYPESIPIKKITKFQQRLLAYEKGISLDNIRNKHAKYYNVNINSSCLQPGFSESNINNYKPMRYPVYLNIDADMLSEHDLKKMRKYGIVTMYPKPLSELKEIKSFCVNCESLYPGGEYLAKRLLTLPTHTLLKKKDIVNIISIVNRVVS